MSDARACGARKYLRIRCFEQIVIRVPWCKVRGESLRMALKKFLQNKDRGNAPRNSPECNNGVMYLKRCNSVSGEVVVCHVFDVLGRITRCHDKSSRRTLRVSR